MKLLFGLILFLFSCQSLLAQQYLVKQKERINTRCQNLFTDSTCMVFSAQFDELYTSINDTSLNEKYSTSLKQKLFFDLQEVKENNIEFLPKKTAKYKELQHYLQAIKQNEETLFFDKLPTERLIPLLPFLKESYVLRQRLKQLSYSHGIVLLKNFDSYKEQAFSEEILKYILHENPVLLKRYYTNKSIQETLLTSTSDTVKLFVKMYQELGASSKAFLLMNEIIKGKLSIAEAHKISENNKDLFEQLTVISTSKNPLGKQAINEELSFMCAQQIRPINAAYEMHDNSSRFTPLKNYSAEELYTILIYSEEEIFTSSFTGGFHILLEKIKENNENGYSFLVKLNFNEFRTFIKMCAGYGLLNTYLNSMTLVQQEKLFAQFLYLENTVYLLKHAVSIADAFGSINDDKLATFIETLLLKNYQSATEKNVKLAYGLLIHLFQDKTQNNTLNEIAKQYLIRPLTQLDSLALFGNDGVHTQLHLFYDDEDGIMSFATFLQHFKGDLWQIKDYISYVKITSKKGAHVSIYANKAKAEKEGTQAILNLLKNNEIEMLVHRGHSFYVNKSIEKLRAETKLVLLGSCGGYHKVLSVLEKSPDAQIIATKQVGSYVINNPLLLQLATDVNQKQTINWDIFWEKLYTKVNKSNYAKDKFNEYIPPHKNLGAAFIQAYKKYE